MKPKPAHVGQHIRDQVIPPGMSVTEAAHRLGVGRPALSNLLNGKAALSPKMATRLERAFGADREALLQLQTAQDRERNRDQEKAVAVRRYVPSLFTIKAQQIDQWAGSTDARSRLPVLLRKLIHATGHDLERVDFPGFDNSQRQGWDGWVEADAATAWIPRGASGWELGTSKEPRRKAESDYAKRLQLPLEERQRCAFVFVTPRNWDGKDDWAKAKEAADDGWREVRAYDASDLEQWLDESIAAPVWLAEQLPTPVPGVKTLEACWTDWASASKPKMTEHLFKPSIEACVPAFKQWLDATPQRPFVVAADSKGEALAFLHCLFRHDDIDDKHGDRVAVFESTDTLAELAASSEPFIPIAANAETEERLATLQQRMHCITTCPRNAPNVKPDFALKLLGDQAFREGLEGMGVEPHEIDRLVRESGRSPTVLRRRLSNIRAIKTPRWVNDKTLASQLTPMCLVGAWHVDSKADQGVLENLAGCGNAEIEKHVAQVLQLEDSPVWSVDQHRGVVSKIDALFAVAPQITNPELELFFSVAEDVLSEPDPRLDLPDTEQWAAESHGKVRTHSDALRNGFLETLVLLSVHGNDLFQERLGTDIEEIVSSLVRSLLTPLAERLLSQERDLPAYAEAAPDRFLWILEEDLKADTPEVLRLFEPTEQGLLQHCPRTGLLHAIECVAWNPNHVSRACVLLAELSQVEIAVNVGKGPIESLFGVLGSWMQQTAASLDDRIKILKMLNRRFPDIGRRLCLNEVAGQGFAMHNYRPRWRSAADGAGGLPCAPDVDAFKRCALSLLLSLSPKEHDKASLGDLVESMWAIPADRRSEVWDLIDAWADIAEEEPIANLRERIRCRALRKVGQPTGDSQSVKRARLAYEKLQPRAPMVRHAWLFANRWVEESRDELEEEDLDLEKRSKRIDALRQSAMKEIWAAHGLDGVWTMIEKDGDPATLGRYAAPWAADPEYVLGRCLDSDFDETRVDEFMRAFVAERANPAESTLLLDLSRQVDSDQSARLWTCAPFDEKTWRALDQLPEETTNRYWRTVSPLNYHLTGAECAEVVDNLLNAGRPSAAFVAVQYQWGNVETALLKRLLSAVAAGSAEDEGVLTIQKWRIAGALKALDARAGVTMEEMARLEFAFVQATFVWTLDHTPNLAKRIAASPAFFVELLSYLYKRDAAASKVYHLLSEVDQIPGTKDDGSIDQDELQRWVKEARQLCAHIDRKAVGDLRIGEFLAKAPEDDDGNWPPYEVCEILEAVKTKEIMQGFGTGKFNARGVFWRSGEGGDMERQLAAEYRRNAQRLRFDYPFVGRILYLLAERYDDDAGYEDRRAILSKRLNTWG